MPAKKAAAPKKAAVRAAASPLGAHRKTAPMSAAEQRVAAVNANLGKRQSLSDFLSEIGWN